MGMRRRKQGVGKAEEEERVGGREKRMRGLMVPRGERTKVGHGYSPALPWPPRGLLDDVRSCCKVPQDFYLSFFLSFLHIFILFSTARHIFFRLSQRSRSLLWPSPTVSCLCLDEFLQDAEAQAFLTCCSRTRATFPLNFLLFLIRLSDQVCRIWPKL